MNRVESFRGGVLVFALIALSFVGCVSAERNGRKIASEAEEAERMETESASLRSQIEAFNVELTGIRAMMAGNPRWPAGKAWVENEVNRAYLPKARRRDNCQEIEILKRRLHGLKAEVEAIGEFRRMDW